MAEVAGGAGAGGGVGDAGAGAGGTAPSGQSGAPGASAAAGGQPGAPGGAAAAAAAQEFKYQEDRSKWVHPDALRNRLNEAKTAHQRELTTLQQQLEQERRRIQALAGVNPQNPEDAQADEIRQALFKVEPRLAKLLETLSDEKLERLMAAADNSDVVEQTTRAVWDRHADTMLGTLKQTVAEKTGLELTPRQSDRLSREFTVYVQGSVKARQRAQETGDTTYDFNNDVLARYNRGDQTLLEEFAKEFLDDWYEPVKKQATAAQVRRLGRPTPQGGRARQTMTQGPPQIDYNNEDAFKDALLKARQAG